MKTLLLIAVGALSACSSSAPAPSQLHIRVKATRADLGIWLDDGWRVFSPKLDGTIDYTVPATTYFDTATFACQLGTMALDPSAQPPNDFYVTPNGTIVRLGGAADVFSYMAVATATEKQFSCATFNRPQHMPGLVYASAAVGDNGLAVTTPLYDASDLEIVALPAPTAPLDMNVALDAGD